MGGSVKTAVLPVAGLGTRVLPGAKTTPKNLLNIVDRPILSYIVEEARAAGIEHFVFIVGRGQGAIEDYFDSNPEIEGTLEAKGKLDILADVRRDLPTPGEMSFVRQMAPLGLGHAVWCARDLIGDEPFAVMLPDVIMQADPSVLKQLIDTGYIEQVPGPVDRRQRLLYATAKGRALDQRLTEPQAERIRAALAPLGPEGRIAAERFLRLMIDPAERDKVAQMIEH
jgi:NDP-sugar pyrophosphorylase family protein